MCFEFNKGVKATLHYFNVKWNVHPEITLCISKEYVSNTYKHNNNLRGCNVRYRDLHKSKLFNDVWTL